MTSLGKKKKKKERLTRSRLNFCRGNSGDDNVTNRRYPIPRILSKFVNQEGRKNGTLRWRDRPIRVSENTQVAFHNASLPRKTLWRSLVSTIEEKEK